MNQPALPIGADGVGRSNRITDTDRLHDVRAVLFDRQPMTILDVKTAGNASLRVRPFVTRAFMAGRIDVKLFTPCVPEGCDCAKAPVERWRRIAVRGDKLQFKWVR